MSKRQFRQTANDSDNEEEDSKLGSVLADVRDMQKMRKRPAGVNISELQGTQSADSQPTNSDPLKLKTGGMIDMRKLKRADLKDADIEEGIRQTFSKESHLRDEDEEMRKYVEEELSKRKGQKQKAELQIGDKQSKADDDTMYELPENLKRYQSKRTENMLSNQMLCGIPEVNLGIEAKIRNIEETEAAKLKLLKEAIEKKKSLSEKLTAQQNRVKDLAKNYVQHSIYNIQETTVISSEVKKPIVRPRTEPVPVVADDTPKWIQDGKTVERPSDPTKLYRRPDSTKPTDKQTLDKFKNKFVRHQKKN